MYTSCFRQNDICPQEVLLNWEQTITGAGPGIWLGGLLYRVDTLHSKCAKIRGVFSCNLKYLAHCLKVLTLVSLSTNLLILSRKKPRSLNQDTLGLSMDTASKQMPWYSLLREVYWLAWIKQYTCSLLEHNNNWSSIHLVNVVWFYQLLLSSRGEGVHPITHLSRSATGWPSKFSHDVCTIHRCIHLAMP